MKETKTLVSNTGFSIDPVNIKDTLIQIISDEVKSFIADSTKPRTPVKQGDRTRRRNRVFQIPYIVLKADDDNIVAYQIDNRVSHVDYNDRNSEVVYSETKILIIRDFEPSFIFQARWNNPKHSDREGLVCTWIPIDPNKGPEYSKKTTDVCR